ncbi:hypothetical protein K2224_17995 [Streptomyces sp. BHT-5-2]|uniref:hypothetical protein n=1 Tax=unclassified Streptomyces TaxID=2593676 RepID=UPI001C8EC582|nr:hypothetical protein [Streptomyces sp. BHT-5-2]QZL04802.1 hypothetical protein K2224_17995 [Streptomyces sp. BHT-5-2]
MPRRPFTSEPVAESHHDPLAHRIGATPDALLPEGGPAGRTAAERRLTDTSEVATI